MDDSSETLRTALRAAEAAIRAAISWADPSDEEDAAAIEDLKWSAYVVAARLRQLEAGNWPGRRVGPYLPLPAPATRDAAEG